MRRAAGLFLGMVGVWNVACGTGVSAPAEDAGSDTLDVVADGAPEPGTDSGSDPSRDMTVDPELPTTGDASGDTADAVFDDGADAPVDEGPAPDAPPADTVPGDATPGDEGTDVPPVDCDGAPPSEWFFDCDGDGLAAEGAGAVSSCDSPALPGLCPGEAWVAIRPDPDDAGTIDCDDQDASSHPGADEVCDYVDNDCDGRVDTDAIDGTPWFPDCDHDGVAPFQIDTTILVCFGEPARPPDACQDGGWTDRRPQLANPKILDCKDTDPEVHSLMKELCDGKDNDCDGDVDETTPALNWYADCDQDGFAEEEADSANGCAFPATNPAACPSTGSWTLLEPVAGQVDCNDNDARVHPGQIRFFTTPIAGFLANKAWDFDCDGSATLSFSGACTNGAEFTCQFDPMSAERCFTDASGIQLVDDPDVCYQNLPRYEVCGEAMRRAPTCRMVGMACLPVLIGESATFTAACR